jgi:hypothetical protein
MTSERQDEGALPPAGNGQRQDVRTQPQVIPAKQQLVFLFSSVPPDRPNYKRGVLNALCYPHGHILELSYQSSYLQPELVDDLKGLVNKRAAFVFIDYKGADHNFIPVRYATILSAGPIEPSKTIRPQTRIYVRIELDELIPLSDEWDRFIKKIPSRPKVWKEAKRDYFFVLRHDAPAEVASGLSQADIWNDLVERVSVANVLNDCIFLAAGHVQGFTDSTCELGVLAKDQRAYKLRPNHIYKMDLRIFDRRNKPDANQEIVVRSSSELIVVSQPFATAIGGPVEHTVLLVCKRSIENTLATLVIDVRDSGTVQRSDPAVGEGEKNAALGSTQTGASSGGVICAKPRYFLDVSVPRSTLFWFAIFVFLGVLFASTSLEFFKDHEIQDLLCWLPLTPVVLAIAAKMAGAVFLAAAAYLGFRKLPSGSPGG